MFKTPSRLNEEALVKITGALNANLADGLDLHGQIKVAHWNIKGPQFPSLHPLFETFALALANFNDAIAERAVTLGGKAYGTSRYVAKRSRIADYPQEAVRISTTSRCSRTASTPTSTASAPPATWPRSWLTPIPSTC